MSYHIVQYTNIISDLRCEIQRLKKKIADQASRQVNSDRADIRHVQGKVLSTLPPSQHGECLPYEVHMFILVHPILSCSSPLYSFFPTHS